MEDIVKYIDKSLASRTRALVVTISGPSGSGKTTVADQLASQFHATLLHTDDYYIGKTHMKIVMPRSESDNFDHPSAIDINRLTTDIATLADGHSIQAPLYNMAISEPYPETKLIQPASIIIIEGLAANLPAIRRLSDLKICVTAPKSVRLKRRIDRDLIRKQLPAATIRQIFVEKVEPNYIKHYRNSDRKVDFVLKG